MYINYWYDMDSFGADCPMNWEEIAGYLNNLLNSQIDDSMDDRDISELSEKIWWHYWNGDYPDAPVASAEKYEEF